MDNEQLDRYIKLCSKWQTVSETRTEDYFGKRYTLAAYLVTGLIKANYSGDVTTIEALSFFVSLFLTGFAQGYSAALEDINMEVISVNGNRI